MLLQDYYKSSAEMPVILELAKVLVTQEKNGLKKKTNIHGETKQSNDYKRQDLSVITQIRFKKRSFMSLLNRTRILSALS